MILLQHLSVRAFKQLREIEIWFPSRGSILVEGRNEAGKSALFEAIFFALYGAPLTGEENQTTLEDLIPHGGIPVELQLSLSAMETTLEIHRKLVPPTSTRRIAHEAHLIIRRPEVPPEEIDGPQAVNACILQELNGLDADSFRNSCFMEQKGLDRLERLGRDQRNTAIARLLGIERLRYIEKELREEGDTRERLVSQLRVEYEVAALRQAASDAEDSARRAIEQSQAARLRVLLEERDSRTTALRNNLAQIATHEAECDSLMARLEAASRLRALQDELATVTMRLEEAGEADVWQNETAALLGQIQHIEVSEAEKAADGERDQRIARLKERYHVLALQMDRAEAVTRRQQLLAYGLVLVGLITIAAGLQVVFLWFLLPVVALAMAFGFWRTQNHQKQERLSLGTNPEVEVETPVLKSQLEVRGVLMTQLHQRRVMATELLSEAQDALSNLQHHMLLEGIEVSRPTAVQQSLEELTALHDEVRESLVRRVSYIDSQTTEIQLAVVQERLQLQKHQEEEEALICQRLQEHIAELLVGRGEAGSSYTGKESLAELASEWPTLANVDVARLDSYDEQYRLASQETHYLRQRASEGERNSGLAEKELDVEDCRARLVEAERYNRRYALALEIAEQVRERIVRRILPEAEAHMRVILPELTTGQYLDVQLLAEETENAGAGLSIRLWDGEAGRHVAKNLLSEGTRDQCSLALRLAFALATLPRERGAMPGFILLDDPLSSADEERAQALVKILTDGVIGEQFEQVLLISHSYTFNRQSLQYYIHLDHGRISESNLPQASLPQES
jgi:DNA repair exonuclease SbcCD ATPase subunit